MRILFVNAYFMPETIAFSHLEKDLIEGLVSLGHEIEVICPIPTRGVTKDVYEKYRIIKQEYLYDGKVHVRRFFAPREGKNPLVRAFRYFWCNFWEYQIGKKYKGIDAVFAVSTPPTQGLIAGKIGKKLGCPFIYSLQDIFPDSLVTTGFAKEDSLLWKIGRKIENKTYGYAKRIIVISESCKRNLMEKGVSKDKLTMIFNWVDIERVMPIPRKENKLISEFNIDPNKFLVLYAGNFGAAQGADIVLKVAKKMLSEKDIQFIIFGGGAEYAAAVEYVNRHDLTNVLIYPLLPQERVSEVYSLGDIALITCKPGVGNSGMPSKTWSIMACNTPIIASFDTDSDLAEVIRTADAGRCVDPGNADALYQGVSAEYMKWKEDNVKCCSTRDYVKRNASKDVCVTNYINILKGC